MILLDVAFVGTVLVIIVFEFEEDGGDSDNVLDMDVKVASSGKVNTFGGDRGGEDINFTSGSSIIQSNVCNDETN